MTPQDILEFQEKILTWYTENKRDLPWRRTQDPYAILISETMLQQTQVDRVIPYYERFLATYPTFSTLAQADTHTLLSLWSGLGYNSRALRLRELAKVVVEKCAGKLPSNESELLNLPGIGPYTACAVLAFAFNKDVAVIDTNIRRVLIAELHLKKDISKAALTTIAHFALPKGKSRIWYNALMDYGALICTAKKSGIASLSKQSKFEGSDRFLRGHIVRELTKKHEVLRQDLEQQFDPLQVQRVLEKMMQQEIIAVHEKKIILRN